MRRLVVLVTVPWLAASASAQERAPDGVLAALIAEAHERSRDVAAARAAVAAAAEQRAQATALPDPMLALTYVNDGWSPSLGTEMMTTLGVMASQDLVRPGVRRLRGEIAGRGRDVAELQLERARLSVEAAVRRAYVGLQRAEQTAAIVREQEPLWAQIEASARARYEVGRAAQQDVIRARIERTRVRESLLEAEAEARIQRAALNQLRDRPAETPIDAPAPLALQPLERSLEDLLAEAERVSPELRAAALDEDRGRLAVELARTGGGTDLAVQAGYMNRGGLDPMWQVGLSARLPLRRGRVHAGIRGAEAERQSAAARREAVRLVLRQRTIERAARLDAAARVARLYDESIVPEGRVAVESARAGYETGAGSLYAVLETIVSVARDRVTHLDRVMEHEQLKAALFEWSLEPDGAMRAPASMRPMPAAGMGASTMPAAGGGMGEAPSPAPETREMKEGGM